VAGGPACELSVGEEVLGGGRGRTVGWSSEGVGHMELVGGGMREFCERIGDWIGGVWWGGVVGGWAWERGD